MERCVLCFLFLFFFNNNQRSMTFYIINHSVVGKRALSIRFQFNQFDSTLYMKTVFNLLENSKGNKRVDPSKLFKKGNT